MSISNLLTSGAQAGADLSITCHNVICDAESVFEAGLRVDNIAEYTADNGVSIDGVLLKNGGLTCGAITSGTASMIGAPVNGIDLCNKDYVDALVGGSGYVVGAVSSTDNAAARFNLATGKIIQNSAVIIDDLGVINTPRYFQSFNTDAVSANNITNDFRRGNGAGGIGWIAAQFGANVSGAGTNADRVVVGNYSGEMTVGGHNDGHTSWRPLYLGQNVAGASLNLRGIDIPMTTTNGVSISSTVESTTSTTGSLRTLGGLGVVKNITSAGVIKASTNIASTSTATGAIVSAGGLGVAGQATVGSLSFDGTNALNVYSTLTATGNAWRYAGAYNYGSLCSYHFARVGTMRYLHFKVAPTAGGGGLFDFRIAIAGAGGNVLIQTADAPLTDTYGTVYLKNNGVNVMGYCYIGATTNGYVYVFPPTAWVANTTNEVFAGTLMWSVAV